MSKLLSILVLCGGQSTEHDISLLSAKNVIERLDKNKYAVSVAKIEHNGSWVFFKTADDFFSRSRSHLMQIMPGDKNPFGVPIDCIFPVLHGKNGEDGTIQGMLDILNIPYVGADCLSSAIGMDKEVLKRLLEAAGLPVVSRCLVRKQEAQTIQYAEISKKLGKTVFIKPNSLGSAIGINKAVDEKSFYEALKNAFQYDEYVLIEKAVMGREIECSVLGNENPKVSLPGEIINHTEFYSFDAKYIDGAAATVKTPADLPPECITQLQILAIKAYKTLRTVGMARVDFFFSHEGEIFINEINTIPGFTNISMYPKNWEVSGLSYVDLLDELIQLGIERFAFKQSLVRIYK
ncbi:MAG: D-alanine--D-alanine ligase A [Gammaproteobacteria bacterium RIFCSPHIGHO2_12_FULL_38_11]|nr:MAG: D-alanine--D-alanine ligase A [Gammaproteobacteria bacterium RIFCSPHIGHO2_12_FULL_38_11]